jgi:hypothetical protein
MDALIDGRIAREAACRLVEPWVYDVFPAKGQALAGAQLIHGLDLVAIDGKLFHASHLDRGELPFIKSDEQLVSECRHWIQGASSTSRSLENEKSIVRAANALHRQGWPSAYTVDEALAKWASAIAAVESNSFHDMESYVEAIRFRQWFDDARSFLTDEVAGTMDIKLAALDERFVAATLPTENLPDRVGAGWWLSRLPSKL